MPDIDKRVVTVPPKAKKGTPPKAKVTKVAATEPEAESSRFPGCGPRSHCPDDKKLFLSLKAYPEVVHQVGDNVNWYFKVTNLTGRDIIGPIDFYMSGSEEPIATIDLLPAFGYYDLLITEPVNELDITRRFIVATVWARRGEHGCLLGNVAEATVAVAPLDDATLHVANPNLIITATENTIDVRVLLDIINLSELDVDSLILDLNVIFGDDVALSYTVDGLPSNLFIVDEGKLVLADGQTIGAGERIGLEITNVDKTINLDGFCSESCQSLLSWRLSGKSTINTPIVWEGNAV